MRLERRLEPSLTARIAVPLAAIVAGLLAGAVVIEAGGNDALEAYGTMFTAAVGSASRLAGDADPGGAADPDRAGGRDPGADGAVEHRRRGPAHHRRFGGDRDRPVRRPTGPAAAAGDGGWGRWPRPALWALIAAVPRALFGLNEIIVTLFLNYIAIQLMGYLVNGPWGDRSAIGFAFTPAIPARAELPALTGSLGIGVLIAVAVALAAAWIANRTPLGLTIRLAGAGTRLPEYLQLGVRRLIVAGLGASGAIAGLAGAIQVMGVTQRLEPGISSNYGYSGILVAFLAAGSVLGVVAGAVVYGALIVGGLALQGIGVPFDVSLVVQALIILFLLCGQAALQLPNPAGPGRMNPFWTDTLHQAVISSVPLAIAGLGELLAETAGVINLGVEGMMLIGAVSGYGAAIGTGNLWLALLAAAGAGAAFGLLHAFLTVTLRVNQIAVGLTLVFLGTGLSGYAGQAIAGAPVAESFPVFDIPGLSALPVLGPVLFQQDVVAYGTVLLAILVWAVLRHTALGLNLRAVGEDPATADTAGVPVSLYRYAAVIAGGALAGVAGAYFALSVAHAWAEQITGGSGWIALALVIAANWRPLRLILFALLFGMVESLNFAIQAIGSDFPSSILQMLPYVFTLLVLALSVIHRRGSAGLGPMALGRPYDREERV